MVFDSTNSALLKLIDADIDDFPLQNTIIKDMVLKKRARLAPLSEEFLTKSNDKIIAAITIMKQPDEQKRSRETM